ncbi:helix-turn-helix domain-containing protein [Bradyrhizobium sp. RDM4]
MTQLAQAAGISIGYLSQIERNQSKLPTPDIYRARHR